MLFFKRLELQGFKSFANKTTLDFHPGVTVIVGPNGCGKSNIFDSIRWVLGEQSAKSLRGSRMGDVIFNGSGSMKPTGMSRVNLVLNNEGRHLPTDFDEVSIQRRLFRTGESEYLMNAAQCRLKDITSLCMDTGVGTDSYSVLEQGKVDAIINSRPLERRVIFDEAAGISKYKARKEEALHKLERTEADILRLADIIAEVKRQAGSLKRQANKAERYKRLSNELQGLEMELIVRRFFLLREQSETTEADYGRLAGRVAELRGALREVDEQTLAGRTSAEEVQAALDETHGLQFDLTSRLQEARGRIELATQRIAQGEERRSTLAGEMEELGKRAWFLGEDITRAETEIAENDGALATLAAEYEEKKSRHDAMRADTDGSGAEIRRLRDEINTANRAHHELDNAARLARAMEQKTLDEMSRGDAELALLRQQVDAAEAEREERHATADENDQVLAALRADQATTRANLQAREQEFAGAMSDLEAARRSLQECESHHKALAEMQDNFDGYFRGVRDVMLAARGGILNGVRGVVTSLIEAKGEHELAIEVALGAQAQDIIIENAENGKAALRWLKDQGTGRATFLPLDLIEPRENPERLRQVMAEDGVIGFATDLVKYDPHIERAVRYLLGGVVVVRNMDKAVELQRRGFRTRYVTVDGDMLNPHGAMSGGAVKTAGLLHRTREVKELARQLQDLRRREGELSAAVTELRATIADLRAKHEKIAASAQQQEIEAARTRKDYEVLESRLADKTAQLRRLEEHRGGMESEVAGHRNVQERNAALLEELGGKIRDLEIDLAAAESRATTKQRELSEFSGELNSLMIAISTARERQESRRTRLEDLKREKVRVTETQTERQREAGEITALQEAAHAEIAAQRALVDELESRGREIAEKITHETERKETIQLDLRRLGEHAQVLQRDFNEAQNELHEVELRRTEQRTQLDNIGVQAGEKFALGIDGVIARVLLREQYEEPEPAGPQPLDEAAAAAAPEGIEAGAPAPAGAAAPEEQRDPADVRIPATAEEIAEALAHLREPDDIAARITEIRGLIEAIGPVNVGAIDEYNQLNERYTFLTAQEKDLVLAKGQLAETIHKIDETTTDLFTHAFAEIRENFANVFRRLFGGGRADLVMTEEGGVLDSGIDIVAQPPGKKPTHISLLSGGEKALTAISLLFAIFLRKPSPFCILDEVDAPLDDKNIERFKELVQEFAQTTQFVIITHNKQTMALANTIYGVTMEEQGVSRVVSLRLDEVDEYDRSPQPEAVPA